LLEPRCAAAEAARSSFMAALGWWYAKLLSAAEFVAEAK